LCTYPSRISCFQRTDQKHSKIKAAPVIPAWSVQKHCAEQLEYLSSIVSAYQTPKSKLLREDFSLSKDFDGPSTSLDRRLAIKKKSLLRDQLKIRGAVFQFQTPSPMRDEISDGENPIDLTVCERDWEKYEDDDAAGLVLRDPKICFRLRRTQKPRMRGIHLEDDGTGDANGR